MIVLNIFKRFLRKSGTIDRLFLSHAVKPSSINNWEQCLLLNKLNLNAIDITKCWKPDAWLIEMVCLLL